MPITLPIPKLFATKFDQQGQPSVEKPPMQGAIEIPLCKINLHGCSWRAVIGEKMYIVSRESFSKRALSWHQTGGRSLTDKNCLAPKGAPSFGAWGMRPRKIRCMRDSAGGRFSRTLNRAFSARLRCVPDS